MRYAVCMSHSRPQPSAVDDARFRGSSVYIQYIQTCMDTVTRPTDQPAHGPGYACTYVPVCTSPKTRGDSRRLRAAGCARASPPAGRPSPCGRGTSLAVVLVIRDAGPWRSSGKSRSSQSIPARLIERQAVVRRSCLRVGPSQAI